MCYFYQKSVIKYKILVQESFGMKPCFKFCKILFRKALMVMEVSLIKFCSFNRYLDLINVMTYDLRGSWEGFTGEDSPLFQGPADQGGYIYFNVVCFIDHLLCILQSILFP